MPHKGIAMLDQSVCSSPDRTTQRRLKMIKILDKGPRNHSVTHASYRRVSKSNANHELSLSHSPLRKQEGDRWQATKQVNQLRAKLLTKFQEDAKLEIQEKKEEEVKRTLAKKQKQAKLEQEYAVAQSVEKWKQIA